MEVAVKQPKTLGFLLKGIFTSLLAFVALFMNIDLAHSYPNWKYPLLLLMLLGMALVLYSISNLNKYLHIKEKAEKEQKKALNTTAI